MALSEPHAEIAEPFGVELKRAGLGATGWRGGIGHFARRYPLGAAGAIIMALLVFGALFADLITFHDPLQTDAPLSLAPPTAAHWMGADFMGRDIYSRIVYGARISLAVGIGSTLLGCIFGVAIGLGSGYLGGWVDLIAQRVIDILQALPLLVLALVMAAALGPSLRNTIIAIAIPLIPSVARVIRSNTLALRELPFVEAARGDRHERISHRRAPRSAEHAGAADRAGDSATRFRDPHGSIAVVPRPRHPGALSVLGAHAVGIGGGICAHCPLAGDLSRSCHQPRRVRYEPARRRAARHCSIRGSAS